MNNFVNIPEYTVSQFNYDFKEVIDNNFSYVRIRGEISEVKIATKGQLYITLKDNDSVLSCVLWDQKKKNVKFEPDMGMEVIVTGKVTIWSKFRTTYQVDIDKLELAGEGALLKLIADRKKRLAAKGIFDQNKKKPIPFLPSKIGVITSPTGSVIHDIITKISDRFAIPIELWPTSVQGRFAVENIITAIRGFNSMKKSQMPDVIILARGGGSTEDLMAFNDENLAIAVFNSTIPIISAIGHETDTTIIDYAADIRASTPTAAAEKAVPIRIELEQLVSSLYQRLNISMINKIKLKRDYFENLKKFLKAPNLILNIFIEKMEKIYLNLDKEIRIKFKNYFSKLYDLNSKVTPPLSELVLKKSSLNNFSNALDKAIIEKKKYSRESLVKLSRLMNSNSLASNLKKGYSILTVNNKIIKNYKSVRAEDMVKAKLNKGTLSLVVKKIN